MPAAKIKKIYNGQIKIGKKITISTKAFLKALIIIGIFTVLIVNFSFSYRSGKGFSFEWKPADIKIEKKIN